LAAATTSSTVAATSSASALTQTFPGYQAAGKFTVKVTANDGRTSGLVSALLTITVVANHAPTITTSQVKPSGNPYKYQRVNFLATVADQDSNPLTVTWNFGDGSAAVTGLNPEHTFTLTGTVLVTATADDGRGGVTTSPALPVTILDNNPPLATVNAATVPAETPLFQRSDRCLKSCSGRVAGT